jgi:hypothetical protein
MLLMAFCPTGLIGLAGRFFKRVSKPATAAAVEKTA